MNLCYSQNKPELIVSGDINKQWEIIKSSCPGENHLFVYDNKQVPGWTGFVHFHNSFANYNT